MHEAQTKMAELTRATGNNIRLEVSATEAWRIIRALENGTNALDLGIARTLREVFSPAIEEAARGITD